MLDDITYSDAIEQVMLNNGYFASLSLIYAEFEKYRKKTGLTPDNTIQERVQRDPRFTRIAKGVYALSSFVENIEKNELWYFVFKDEKIQFQQEKVLLQTEKIIEQKIRIGQSYFREKLIEDLKICPITGIDDPRLLVASHIKPWAHSNNTERINIKNWLVLSPLYDKLFDKWIGFITFTLDKRILISNRLSNKNIERLGVQNNQIIKDLIIDGREEFLEYHKKYIFQS